MPYVLLRRDLPSSERGVPGFDVTRRIRSNPVVLALSGWAVTFGNLAIGDGLMSIFGFGPVTSVALPVLVTVTVFYPPAALAALLLHYKEASTSLERLVALYASLLIICANLNFDIVLHAPVSEPPFSRIHAIWLIDEGRVIGFSWTNVLLAAVDCFHFAIETLSTVGYGDIVPVAWYAKLAVDVEILMGLSITILAVGTYFSSLRS